MTPTRFKALVVEEHPDQTFSRTITEKSIHDLPKGEVLIEVAYSSLNYKDALSAIGNKGVTRHYPHTPGIDAAGIVMESSNDRFLPGDKVLVTGYDLGMNTSGGFGQRIRVPSNWIVALPRNLSMKESMVYGTAGFTAALAVGQLQFQGVTPGDGEILVTGASGGVGSMAIALLSKAGYAAVAASGKARQKDYLEKLGAAEVVAREAVTDHTDKPLLKGRWSGVIDTVGGDILATALKTTRTHGTVISCGNVASYALHTTVYPFILRGVRLVGVDSAQCPMDLRLRTWEKMANEWKIDHMDPIFKEIGLEELNAAIDRILEGRNIGRILVNLEE